MMTDEEERGGELRRRTTTHHAPPASRAAARGVDCAWNNYNNDAQRHPPHAYEQPLVGWVQLG